MGRLSSAWNVPAAAIALGVLLALPSASAFTDTVGDQAPVGGQWPLSLVATARNESVNVTLLDPYGVPAWNLNVSFNATHASEALWVPAPSYEGGFFLVLEGWDGTARTRSATVPVTTFCGVECHALRQEAAQQAFAAGFLGALLWTGVAGVVAFAAAWNVRAWAAERHRLPAVKWPRLVVLPDDMPRVRPEYMRLDEERRGHLRGVHLAAKAAAALNADLAQATEADRHLYGFTSRAGLVRLERELRAAEAKRRAGIRGHGVVVRRMRALVHEPPVDAQGVPYALWARLTHRHEADERKALRQHLRAQGEEVPHVLER